jgi:hypothetical protein
MTETEWNAFRRYLRSYIGLDDYEIMLIVRWLNKTCSNSRKQTKINLGGDTICHHYQMIKGREGETCIDGVYTM